MSCGSYKVGEILHCGSCDNYYDLHHYVWGDEIKMLRSQGCRVLLCDNEYADITQVSLHWAYTTSSDGKVLHHEDIESRCTAPENPCDGAFMEDVSS